MLIDALDKAPSPSRLAFVSGRAGRRWLAGVLTIAFLVMMALGFVAAFVLSGRHQVELGENRLVTEDVHILQQALIDAETGVRGFVLTGRSEFLQPYFSGLLALEVDVPVLVPRLDEFAVGRAAEPHAISRRIAALRQIWGDVVSLTENHDPAAAAKMLLERQQKQIMDELRALTGAYVTQQNEDASHTSSRLALERQALLGVGLAGALIAIIAIIYAFHSALRETSRTEAATAASEQAAERVEQLFRMTSMLQSATDRKDANEVLRATTIRLLSGFNGCLYIFNNSRERLELSIAWGQEELAPPPDHLVPSTCWALKRGNAYLNIPGEGVLRCSHHPDAGRSALEIPMTARGQVFGLLIVGTEQIDAVVALKNIQPVAAAIADGMSLALSGISLREQLQSQALRDPLTGLYNRRFLEETLQRLGLDAQRRNAPLAAIMIDLDHFKHVNDRHGHATGDAVLQAVAKIMLSVLRATDIVCRYGGEELAVLLPDCPLEMAMAKAELLRAGIANLTPGPSGATVTASLGVAATPETTSAPAGLLASADAALYEAKQGGRNRVVQAAHRASPADVHLLTIAEA
jgi:diguanylate cyclase (GGDEF)-like protein